MNKTIGTPHQKSRHVGGDGYPRTAIAARTFPTLAPPGADLEEASVLLTIAEEELRAPITPLKMRLQQTRSRLRRAGGPERDINDLSKALYHVERIQQQAALFLDALALERDCFDLAPRWLDLNDAARRLVEIYACADPRRAITLEELDEPLSGVWDGARLEVAMRAMLGNALRYASGDITLRLARQGERAVITVEDSGTGIPPALGARVFEPFVTGAQPNHGLGLGLYVAREIARRHGGEMGVARAGTGGAAFWLTLPLDTR
jgi:signal transduction histidine kinase